MAHQHFCSECGNEVTGEFCEEHPKAMVDSVPSYELELVATKDGLLLQGSKPGEELEYYDVDGEGGKATKISFTPWNQEVRAIEGVKTASYDSDDEDSFWSALETVLTSAREKGVSLPDYAAY